MDYVNPKQLVSEMVEAAGKKAGLSIRDLLLRGFLAGALLNYATSLVVIVLAQGLLPIVGAILFPVGFVILVLLGLELATGNFALLPVGLLSGDVKLGSLLRNWTFVYLGNFLGSIFYAALFYLAVTNFGASDGGNVAEILRQAAQKKTLAYAALGASGWFTALVKGMLCNWMVTLGVVMAMISRSVIGKIVAMWLPIMTFFALGYEHSIVNMFVIPIGMMFHAPVSTGKWLLWNQLPVTIGNIISGALLTGMALYLTYRTPAGADKKPIIMERQAPLSVAEEVGAASL
jgi:formate/nitrite transporter